MSRRRAGIGLTTKGRMAAVGLLGAALLLSPVGVVAAGAHGVAGRITPTTARPAPAPAWGKAPNGWRTHVVDAIRRGEATGNWGSGSTLDSEGYTVSTSDNGRVVLIGEPWSDDPSETATAAGQAVLLMETPTNQWVSHTFWNPAVVPSNPTQWEVTNAYFGGAVAVSADGDVAVVSAPGLDFGYDFPSAYVFDLALNGNAASATFAGYVMPESATGGNPSITPSDFGVSVAVAHDAASTTTDVFVGAPNSAVSDGPGSTSSGAVFEYTDPILMTYGGGNDNYAPDENATILWALGATQATPLSGVGTSLALAPGDWVFSGAPSSTGAGGATQAGALVAWNWQPWNLAQTSTAPGPQGQVTEGVHPEGLLGASVASSATGAVVAAGEPGADDPYLASVTATGAVAVFDFGGAEAGPARGSAPTPVITCAYDEIGPQGNAVAGLGYGSSVAVSDDGTTILVGAPTTPALRINDIAPAESTSTPAAYVEYSAGPSWQCGLAGDAYYTETQFDGPVGSFYGASVAMAGNLSQAFVTAPSFDVETSFEPGETQELIGPGPPGPGTISGSPGPGEVGQSYSFSFTVGGNPPPTVSVTSGSLPPGLSLAGATVSGTPTTAGSYPVTLTATNTNGSNSDATTFVIDAASPAVTKVAPNGGTTGGGTSVTLTGSGFTGATAVKFGAKAASFTVVSDSQIAATSPAGTGKVAVTVTGPTGTSSVLGPDHFTYATTDVRITTSSLPAATKGTVYSQQLAATGGTGTDTWSATSRPKGLSLSPSGLLSGTPTTKGTFHITFKVVSGTSNDTKVLTLTVS